MKKQMKVFISELGISEVKINRHTDRRVIKQSNGCRDMADGQLRKPINSNIAHKRGYLVKKKKNHTSYVNQ